MEKKQWRVPLGQLGTDGEKIRDVIEKVLVHSYQEAPSSMTGVSAGMGTSTLFIHIEKSSAV